MTNQIPLIPDVSLYETERDHCILTAMMDSCFAENYQDLNHVIDAFELDYFLERQFQLEAELNREKQRLEKEYQQQLKGLKHYDNPISSFLSETVSKEKLHHEVDLSKEKAFQERDDSIQQQLAELKSQIQQDLEELEARYQTTIELCQQKINQLESKLTIRNQDSQRPVRDRVY